MSQVHCPCFVPIAGPVAVFSRIHRADDDFGSSYEIADHFDSSRMVPEPRVE
jgi:hypothetical protein